MRLFIAFLSLCSLVNKHKQIGMKLFVNKIFFFASITEIQEIPCWVMENYSWNWMISEMLFKSFLCNHKSKNLGFFMHVTRHKTS